MPKPDPYATGASLLAAVAAAWTGATLPKQQYVAEGSEAPVDGEQLVVTVGLLRPGLVGMPLATPRPPRIQPISQAYSVELWRDREAGLQQARTRQTALPTKTQNVTAGRDAGADLLAMLAAFLKIREDGSWVRHSTMMLIEGVRPIGPSGGFVGVSGSVSALLGH